MSQSPSLAATSATAGRSRRPVLGLVLLGLVATAAAADAKCRPIQTLPTVITEPGLYCLSRDFETRMAGGAAIEVRADHVTLDLQGHLIDNRGAGLGNRGLGVFSWERSHVVVRNGSLAGFGEAVALSGPFGTDLSAHHLVEGLRISDSTRSGIGIVGTDSVVRGNSIQSTGRGSSQKEPASGIFAAGWRHRVIDNDVIGVVGSVLDDIGILFAGGGSHMALGNRISSADVAIWLDSNGGQYRDNVANEVPCCDAFHGGTDLGGNSWH